MNNDEDIKTKAERRQHKKARRQFTIHGKKLREVYQNIVFKRLKGEKKPKGAI